MTDPLNITRIAKLVGKREDLTATPRERAIAKKLRKLGEKMERDGYLPAIRRAHMLRVLHEEAGKPAPMPHEEQARG